MDEYNGGKKLDMQKRITWGDLGEVIHGAVVGGGIGYLAAWGAMTYQMVQMSTPDCLPTAIEYPVMAIMMSHCALLGAMPGAPIGAGIGAVIKGAKKYAEHKKN